MKVSFLMYFRADVLSIQNTESKRSICNSFLHSMSMQLAIVAVISSILGIVTHLKGATRAFPITDALCTSESLAFNNR